MARINEEGPDCTTEKACSNDGKDFCALAFTCCIATMDGIDLPHLGKSQLPLRLSHMFFHGIVLVEWLSLAGSYNFLICFLTLPISISVCFSSFSRFESAAMGPSTADTNDA
jgi:hypothetical protein